MIEFGWNWSALDGAFPNLWGGLVVAMQATLFASMISVVLGLLFAIIRIAEIPVLSPVAVFLVNFLRGTPFLIQLYFMFYVLPRYGMSVGLLATGILALGVSMSGYMSEVFRASIEEIPIPQWEACLALGLPKPNVWLTIVMPQALRTAVPMLGSYVILMFKETAILSTIGISELLSRGMEIGFITFRFVEPLTIVGLMYLVISFAAAKAIRVLEARLQL